MKVTYRGVVYDTDARPNQHQQPKAHSESYRGVKFFVNAQDKRPRGQSDAKYPQKINVLQLIKEQKEKQERQNQSTTLYAWLL